jgi:hypothetical protein
MLEAPQHRKSQKYVGKIFRHYTGDFYLVTTVTTDMSNPSEPVTHVVYVHLAYAHNPPSFLDRMFTSNSWAEDLKWQAESTQRYSEPLSHFFGTVWYHENPFDQSVKECSQTEYLACVKSFCGYKTQQRFEEYPKVTKFDKDSSVFHYPNVCAWIFPMILVGIALWIMSPVLFFVVLFGLYYQKRKDIESLSDMLMDLINRYKIVKKKTKKEIPVGIDKPTEAVDPKPYPNNTNQLDERFKYPVPTPNAPPPLTTCGPSVIWHRVQGDVAIPAKESHHVGILVTPSPIPQQQQ